MQRAQGELNCHRDFAFSTTMFGNALLMCIGTASESHMPGI